MTVEIETKQCYNCSGDEKKMIEAEIFYNNDIKCDLNRVSVQFSNIEDEQLHTIIDDFSNLLIDKGLQIQNNKMETLKEKLRANSTKIFIDISTIEQLKSNSFYFFKPTIMKTIRTLSREIDSLSKENKAIELKINKVKKQVDRFTAECLLDFLEHTGFTTSLYEKFAFSQKFYFHKSEEELYSLVQNYIENYSADENASVVDESAETDNVENVNCQNPEDKSQEM